MKSIANKTIYSALAKLGKGSNYHHRYGLEIGCSRYMMLTNQGIPIEVVC